MKYIFVNQNKNLQNTPGLLLMGINCQYIGVYKTNIYVVLGALVDVA